MDAIINHMTGTWNENVGTGGSNANFGNWHYPAVPYGRNDFNSPQCVISGNDYRCCPDRVSTDLNPIKQQNNINTIAKIVVQVGPRRQMRIIIIFF